MYFTEGSIRLFLPEEGTIFYNPRAVKARELGIAALKVIGETKTEIRVLDVFSGTGVRGLRYAIEVPEVSFVVFNDSSHDAIKILRKNIEENSLNIPYKIFQEEARTLFCNLQRERIFFDFIDLDAFGTPVLFFDHVFRVAKREEAYIYITATDTATLCGIQKEAALRNYSAITQNVPFCHEIGARIVIKAFQDSCGRQGYLPTLLFTFFDGTGLRILFKIKKSKEEFKRKSLDFIVFNPRTKERFVVSHKEIHKVEKGKLLIGPLYTGKLHNEEFLSQMFKYTDNKIQKLLKTFLEENPLPPFYYSYPKLCKKLRVSMAPLRDVLKKLEEAGYKSSRTHFSPDGFKTDAPIEVILGIISSLHNGK